MGHLRDRLQQDNPGLAQALARSWEIAREEWLPALGVNKGSFNSYPHLRNLERYLDDIVPRFPHLWEAGRLSTLTGAEIYLLLAAVLFHDVGRIKGNKGHERQSEVILNEKHAALGVPSAELARCLGRICQAHGATRTEDFRRNLEDIAIVPLGRVRPLLLAGLVFLADHMDSAYTRVLPDYLRENRSIEVVGAFRRAICGVTMDKSGRCLLTQIGSEFSADNSASAPKAGRDAGRLQYANERKRRQGGIASRIFTTRVARNYARMVYCLPDEDSRHDEHGIFWAGTAEQMPELHGLSQDRKELMNESPSALKLSSVIRAAVSGRLKDSAVGGIRKLAEKITTDTARASGLPFPRRNLGALEDEGIRFLSCDWLIARRLLMVKKHSRDTDKPWPPAKVLAMVMGDIRANVAALKVIREDLAAAGIPIRAWLIEHDEHLYNEWGDETYEPIFSEEYLERVARSMWDLSTQIFGSSTFTYETLADHLREPDVDRARRAARRIAIVTGHPNTGNGSDSSTNPTSRPQPPIWAGTTHWHWRVTNSTGKGDTYDCLCFSIKPVLDAIGSLADPSPPD